MEEYIKVLWELQQLDLDVLNIEKRINDVPAKRLVLEQKLKSLEDEKSFKEDSRDKLIQEKERREREIEQENEKIKMVESRLSHIRNQKDYLEMRKKIELAKKSNKLREDEVLKKMEEIEQINKTIEEFMTTYLKEKEKISEGLALYENEVKELEKQKEEILQKRSDVANKLDAGILKTYEHLRKNCRGIGVSRARNESCEGCFMNLPPQLYNMVMKGDKLYNCPFCQRYLVYIPEKNEENK
ncbi:MAG: C4-type zinc ribbon domain-containing protein [bacterium]